MSVFILAGLRNDNAGAWGARLIYYLVLLKFNSVESEFLITAETIKIAVIWYV